MAIENVFKVPALPLPNAYLKKINDRQNIKYTYSANLKEFSDQLYAIDFVFSSLGNVLLTSTIAEAMENGKLCSVRIPKNQSF